MAIFVMVVLITKEEEGAEVISVRDPVRGIVPIAPTVKPVGGIPDLLYPGSIAVAL